MAAPLRIASVPAGHPYVAHLAGPGVERLPDPRPPGAPPGQWWPPEMLRAAWIRAHADAFDLLHLHFGAESFTPAGLADTLGALRAARRPFVLTVHDLEHPQLADPARHEAQLELLVPAADTLITLTEGAAEEIERRWGRRPTVVAHPHLFPLEAPFPPDPSRSVPVLGLHLRDLRPSIDGPGATRTLLAAAALLQEATVRVFLHDRARDEAARAAVRALCAEAPAAELVEAPRPDDAALAAELAGLSVSVLPYRHGTHSGWVELCWDLAVPVAAPRIGQLDAQHPDPGFLQSFTVGDAPELAEALRPLLGRRDRERVQRERRVARRVQQEEIAAAHLDLYRAALASA